MATVGYLRVSTVDQNNEKFRHEILELANREALGKVQFVEEKISGTVDWRKRKLATVLDNCKKGDNIIVPELSRLGRSALGILEVLKVAKETSVNIYAIKGNWRIDGSLQSKVLVLVFSMLSEIERDLISMRTKEALQARRNKGLPLGRPKGSGHSKLDDHIEEVVAFLKNGSTIRWIAKHFEITESALHRWLRVSEKRQQHKEIITAWRERKNRKTS